MKEVTDCNDRQKKFHSLFLCQKYQGEESNRIFIAMKKNHGLAACQKHSAGHKSGEIKDWTIGNDIVEEVIHVYEKSGNDSKYKR